ncbi:unnamed protein product [Timema podura]|uniref:Uncharacterized protein n=1 Tax=Timema podura TaxID=61482 RepID=A0ABN7PEU4_TIMPD|nr:unnamed protein product [Timema podura]
MPNHVERSSSNVHRTSDKRLYRYGMSPGVQRRESNAAQTCVFNRLHRSYARGNAHLNILEHGSRTYHNN